MEQVLIAGIVFFAGVLAFFIIVPSKKQRTAPPMMVGDIMLPSNYLFVLKTKKGDLKFTDPFDSFLIYGGMNSGKTKSIGKPLLGEYMRHRFAGFIYDYKDFDLTKTVIHFKKKYNYPFPVYNISFADLSRTHRTNPIAPKVINSENLFIQLMDDFMCSFQIDGKRDEWFSGALGILKGVAINFYYQYPQLCTIPHIVNFVCSAGTERISSFLELSHQSRTLGSAFLDAKGSPKTQSSYLSSVTNYLSTLSFDKNACYVLSGNDFDFNLLDNKNPKLVCIANSFQTESLISPIVALMLTASSRQFTMYNKIPFFYFLDEATTFKIPDFEKLPSVLREYKCSFTFITQSGAKVERRYSKLERSSIEANFGNQFYGRTKDIEALKNYPLVFGKFDKKKKSRTSGRTTTGTSQSQTISIQKEERYDSHFFANLKAGEFAGTTAHCNRRDFFLPFEMYQEKEEDLPIIKPVTRLDIETCYDRVVSDISGL